MNKKSNTMNPPYRIFLSSTMDDLEEERDKIAIEIVKSENVPIMAENMINVLDRPRAALEKKLDGCDGYLGVFHRRWGYVPKNDNPDKLSVTELEYERAKKRDIPRCSADHNNTLKKIIEAVCISNPISPCKAGNTTILLS